MAMRAAVLSGLLGLVVAQAPTTAPTTAPTSAPTIPTSSTIVSQTAPAKSTSVTVSDIQGCLPGGNIRITPPSNNVKDRTITTCTAGTGTEGTVSFALPLEQAAPVNSAVVFTVPADATISTAQTAAGSTTAAVNDVTTCSVGGSITFSSSNPETATVSSCGIRRLAEETEFEMMADERRLVSTVTFSPATTNVQPSGTAILFTPAPTPPVCFGAESSVQVAGLASPQALSDLRAGDHVLANGAFTAVLGFLHDFAQNGEVVVVEHARGELRASGNHIVFVDGQDKEVRSVKIGDTLRLFDGSLSPVVALRHDATSGLRAPLTASGLIDVDGIVASNYANGQGVEVPHAAMHAAFSLVRLVSPVLRTDAMRTSLTDMLGLVATAQALQLVS
eukprot:TRINITY_DN1375_c0_g1_i1.p1 TRINITY_DN1375_c0_g1~~TRINITY_DN1375_c0_g1_i1.p1  ORF type:complete len:418 (+),score=56.63 TRINITY_DN1375_c0_g1_i1:83-1255(+)